MWYRMRLLCGIVVFAVVAISTSTAQGQPTAPEGYTVTTFASGLSTPGGLVFDRDGNLIVCAEGAGIVYSFSRSGTPMTLATGLPRVFDPAITPGGRLFVTAGGSGPDARIFEIRLPEPVEFYSDRGAMGIEWHEGFIYFTQPGSGSVQRADLSGNVSLFADGLGGDITGLRFGPDGHLYVANNGNGTIFRVSPTGNVEHFLSGLERPEMLAFDADGNLFFTALTFGRIYKVDANKAVTVFVTGVSRSDFRGITFDTEGDLYSSETDRGVVYKISGPKDCNANGIIDVTDIESGESEDLNEDGIPDECDCVEPPAGLIAWWPGDGNANDLAGNSDGSSGDEGSFAPGLVKSGNGEAFSLDGSGAAVVFPDSSSLNPRSEITVSAWVRFDFLREGMGIIQKDDGFNRDYILQNGSADEGPSRVSFVAFTEGPDAGPQPGNNRGIAWTTGIEAETWYHLAGTYDGDFVRLYVDGELRNETPHTGGNLRNTETPVRLGSSFAGLIDEAQIHDRALSVEEIRAIASARIAGVCKSPPPGEARVEWLPGTQERSVLLKLHSNVPFRGGELGIAYDPNRVTAVSVGPGANFPGEVGHFFFNLEAPVHCSAQQDLGAGLVIGWINEGTSVVQPAGDYELFEITFQPAAGDEGGLCSPLKFVDCLGVPEAPARNSLAGESQEAVPLRAIDATVCGSNGTFRRGDPNGDGRFDISDPVYLLGCQFLGEECSSCPDAADSNDDGRLDLSDAIYLLQWRFSGGAAPPAPFSSCGVDRTPDSFEDCISPNCDG